MVNHTKKAKRVDKVKNNFYTEDDVLYWLPEVDAIYVEELRDATMRTFIDGCPKDFVVKPSSSTGKYHSPDERGKYGNLIHTKRVFAEYCNISESWVELGIITPEEKEQGKAAALVHDMMKYGWPSEQNEHTINDHDLAAAAVAKYIGSMSDDVVRLIATHMGSWGQGPNPKSRNELLLHTADKSSARQENDIGIYFPAEELLEEWPELTIAEVEDGEAV